MINICPFCGKYLSRLLHDGISLCQNCERSFDNSLFYRVLTASWFCRKQNIEDVEILSQQYDLDEKSSKILEYHIIQNMLSHDQFYKVLLQYDFSDHKKILPIKDFSFEAV